MRVLYSRREESHNWSIVNTTSEKRTRLMGKECHDRVDGTNDCVAINVGNGESLEKVKMRSCLAKNTVRNL